MYNFVLKNWLIKNELLLQVLYLISNTLYFANNFKAKMFATHRVVPLEERARVKGRMTCPTHGEPYILYSMESRNLACIVCFNNATFDSRSVSKLYGYIISNNILSIIRVCAVTCTYKGCNYWAFFICTYSHCG